MTLAGSDVFLNGNWLARDKAAISVFDRGFIFGDGVYEMIPAYHHMPFLAQRHIKRLKRSMKLVGIDNPQSDDAWLELIQTAATRQDFGNQRIYLQVTRGVAQRAHKFPEQVTPTILLFVDPLIKPSRTEAIRGSKAITLPDFRWQRGDIKSISLMAAVLCSEQAAAAGATETILIRDGLLTEGASSNILIVKDGKLSSPPIDPRILAGVTLSYISEIADLVGHPIEYTEVTEEQLRTADEILLTSSGKELVAITALDDKVVGSGKAGPMFECLYDRYHAGLPGARQDAVAA